MKLIAILFFWMGQLLMPCNHMFFADKSYTPKRSAGYFAYILREHCINCGMLRYPVSGGTFREFKFK
jgi:hypothetical protein